jgi:PAS domain S-box-containing protein
MAPATPDGNDRADIVGRSARWLGRLVGRFRKACSDPALAVAVTVLIGVVATLGRMAISDEQPRFITYYPAVAFTALFVGMWGGILLTILSTLFATWAFVRPYYGFAVENPNDWISITIFLVTGVMISIMAALDRLREEAVRRDDAFDLARSRERQATIVESLREGVIEFSATGAMLDCNPSAERILGRSRARLLAEKRGVGDWDVRDARGQPMEIVEHPLARVLATGQPCWDTVIGLAVDGRILRLLVNLNPIRRPDQQEISGVVVSFSDITDRIARERELSESRARFVSIVTSAMDAIVSIDDDGRILLFNAAAERMTGWSADEMIGRTFDMLIPEAERAAHMGRFGRLPHEEPAGYMKRDIVVSMLHRNGGEVPVEASVSRVEASGRVMYTVVMRDISERLAAQKVDTRLATVVRSSPDAIMTIDLEGRILTWNDAAERMFGYSETEAVGMPIAALSFTDQPMDGHWVLARIVAGESVKIEALRRRADGSGIEVLSSGAPLRDAAGTVIGGIAIMTDISERKRGERRLAERDAELRHTLAAAGLGVWWWDVATGEIHCDERSRMLFGVGETATVETIGARLTAPGRDAILALARDLVDETASHRLELEIAGPGGTVERWISVTTRRRRIEGTAREIWGTVADVSERRQAERALKAVESNRRLEALGRMTGGIAHDFNNLLTIISGNLQLLESVVEDEAGRRWLEEALRATSAGTDLNARLTTFARQRRLEPVVTDLRDRVAQMIGMIRRSVGKTITVDYVSAQPDCLVRVDAAEIETALLNLVFNARDALPGGGHVAIEVRGVDIVDGPDLPLHAKPGRYARLSVSDDGVGMSEDVRARAFEPFFTTKSIGRGTGLGLATLHGFVRQSGGFVTLSSEPGRGTRVAIHLPCAGVATGATGGATPDGMARGEGLVVLAVEDDAGVATVTRHRLEELGYTVIQAGDVRAALARLAETDKVDLVFSDIVMPGGLSGIDLARRLARERPDLPVLLTTGFAEELSASEGGDLPPVLRKPYSRFELATALATAITRHGAAQPAETSAVKT